jgi:hypothetical protein
MGICSKNRRKWLKSPVKWFCGRLNILPASQERQQQQNLHVLTVVNRIYTRKQQSYEERRNIFEKSGKNLWGIDGGFTPAGWGGIPYKIFCANRLHPGCRVDSIGCLLQL